MYTTTRASHLLYNLLSRRLRERAATAATTDSAAAAAAVRTDTSATDDHATATVEAIGSYDSAPAVDAITEAELVYEPPQ